MENFDLWIKNETCLIRLAIAKISWVNIIVRFVKVIRIQSAHFLFFNFFNHVDVYVLNLSLVSS